MRHFLSSIFWGFFVSAMGFGALYLFGQVVTLECSRAAGRPATCVKESRLLGLLDMGEEGMGEVRGASVEESCDDEGCTYRVVVQTSRGAKPLTSYRSSGYRDKQEVADKINRFVSSPAERTLNLKVSTGLLGIMLPLIFIAAGPLLTVNRIVKGPR